MKKIMNIIITVLLCFGMITINILPISAFNQSGVIVEKEIYLNLPVDDILQPRASVAMIDGKLESTRILLED